MKITKPLQNSLDSLRHFGVSENAIQHLLVAIGHDKEENNKTRYKERADLVEFVFKQVSKKTAIIVDNETELAILEKICEGCDMPKTDSKSYQMQENAKKLKIFLDDKDKLQKD